MKVNCTSNELQIQLNDTIKAYKNGTTTNRDIAFISLQLYKMTPSVNKKQFIQLLTHTMPNQNATTTYNNIQTLIKNNHNISSPPKHIHKSSKTQYLKVTYSTRNCTQQQNKHRIFHQKYMQKLTSFVSVFLGYPINTMIDYSNVFTICAEYLNQIVLHMCIPDENVFISRPLDVLTYLYTGKTTDYFQTTENKTNDKQYTSAVNIASNKNKCLLIPSVDTADAKIYIISLFEQFHEDCNQINDSTIAYHEQSAHNICVSLFEYMINSCRHSSKPEPTKWNFCYYMMRFLFDNKLYINIDSDVEKRKSFGLFFQREICTKYNLKCGPYSKVKNSINKWAKEMFCPTIYGWWDWYNQTLDKWVSFPIQLKQYFEIFNDAYGNGKHDVHAMDCHFKIVRRIGDFKMQNKNDAIPICINSLMIHEEYDDFKMESDFIYHPIYSTIDRFTNQTKPQICQDSGTVKNSNRLVKCFVNEVICSYSKNYGLIPDIISIISNYIIKQTLNVPLIDDNCDNNDFIPKKPLSVLCYLYRYKITDVMRKIICRNKNVSQLKQLLKSDGILTPLKTLYDIQKIMPTQNTDIQLFFGALIYQYFTDIRGPIQFTPKQMTLSLFKDTIHSTPTQKCTDHYRFVIWFYDYVKQNNCREILTFNRGSLIVHYICQFFSKNSKKYHKAMDCILSDWCINNRSLETHNLNKSLRKSDEDEPKKERESGRKHFDLHIPDIDQKKEKFANLELSHNVFEVNVKGNDVLQELKNKNKMNCQKIQSLECELMAKNQQIEKLKQQSNEF
eukprot:333114_1